jgi:hypothetical protein
MRHATSLFAVLLAALALSAAAPARADDESRLSGILQLDLTNAYFFRGILNERDGLIAQPWAELYVSLYSAEDGAIRDVTLGAGVWTSIHSEETLAANSPESVYETDLYPLLSVGFANGLTLTTTYYFYTSPNDAFDTVEELNFTLAWDDSEVFAFPLAPWVNVAIETKLTSLGDHEGTGVQFGIEPTLFELTNGVSFSLPLEMGLAIEDYYEEADGSEDTFGYVSFGLAVSIPLAFVPGPGSWSLGLSGKGLYFGDTLAEVNEGDELYPVVMGSLSIEF